MHLERFRLDQIQNGPLSAIIYFHMLNILQTLSLKTFAGLFLYCIHTSLRGVDVPFGCYDL